MKGAGRRAELPEQRRDDGEAKPPCQQGRDDEEADIEAAGAARNRYQLVGERGEAAGYDDPGTPFVAVALEIGQLVLVAPEVEKRAAEGIEEEVADRVAEEAAGDRRQCTDAGQQPRPGPLRENHGDEQQIRRDREERAFRKRHGGERPDGMPLAGERERPVIEPAERPRPPLLPGPLVMRQP